MDRSAIQRRLKTATPSFDGQRGSRRRCATAGADTFSPRPLDRGAIHNNVTGLRSLRDPSSWASVDQVCVGDLGSADGPSLFHRMTVEESCEWLARNARPRKSGSSDSLASRERKASRFRSDVLLGALKPNIFRLSAVIRSALKRLISNPVHFRPSHLDSVL